MLEAVADVERHDGPLVYAEVVPGYVPAVIQGLFPRQPDGGGSRGSVNARHGTRMTGRSQARGGRTERAAPDGIRCLHVRTDIIQSQMRHCYLTLIESTQEIFSKEFNFKNKNTFWNWT